MTQAAALAAYGSNSPSNRNRIINGDMRIDQRNAGASVTPTNGAYTLDRWATYVSQASKITIQQNAGAVSPPTGFTSYLGITVDGSANVTVGASDYFFIQQTIEGYNVADFGFGAAGAATITFSFWVRSSVTGTFGGALYNSGGSRSYPYSYVINSANTWEQKTVTVVGDTTGTWQTTTSPGLQITFSLGTGSTYNGAAGSWAGATYYGTTGAATPITTNSATFYITGVQLEAGSVATPFENRQYGQEYALCQRYYQYGENSSFGYMYSGNVTSGSAYWHTIYLPTELRANGTATPASPAAVSNITNTTPSVESCTTRVLVLNFSANGTGAAYIRGTYTISAEL